MNSTTHHCKSRFDLRRGLATGLVLSVVIALSQQVSANLFGVAEPLSPEAAFASEIASADENSVTVRFSIADGYYLYRDKLKFAVDDMAPSTLPADTSGELTDQDNAYLSNDQPVTLDSPGFADALIVEDDFFGQQAIFRDSTTVTLPYSSTPGVEKFTLSVEFQGCADIGLCYPPTTIKHNVEIPPGSQINQLADLTSTVTPESSLTNNSAEKTKGSSLSDILAANQENDDLLPPELAYLPQIVHASNEAINITWFIEDGYYLYRDKISLSLLHDSQLEISEIRISEGTKQYDEFFGDVSILRHSAEAQAQLSDLGSKSPQSLANSTGQLIISYQGCADIGVCFPPSQTTLPVVFSAAAATPVNNSLIVLGGADKDNKPSQSLSNVNIAQQRIARQPASSIAPPTQSEQDRLSSLLGSSSLWLTIVTFFGFGLLLAFTPCVLPMIPILSSLIVGQGQSMSTGRAFQLSLVYVLVMASTYAVVGVVVGLSGYNVQAFLQDPVVLSVIAALFVGLSLSMFGFYELQMPTSLQNRLTQWSNKQGGGQVGGVAAMGFISTLIVGPCVTAPLAGALLYIARTGDALIGGVALFSLGLGMGAPLLLIGTSAGKLVPKAGAWMNTTKHLFGILMLAMAIYLISRFLPITIVMALYGILALISGVYMGATDALSSNSSGWERLGKGAGLVVSLYGVALLVGALAGGSSYTRPLAALANTGVAQSDVASNHALPFQRIKTVDNLRNVVAMASAEGRPVMLDFYADWCVSCKEMEAYTFSDERVQSLLASAIVVQADVTANDADDQALLKEFDLFGPPGIIFYNASGSEIPAARVVGFMNADNFTSHIRSFIGRVDT